MKNFTIFVLLMIWSSATYADCVPSPSGFIANYKKHVIQNPNLYGETYYIKGVKLQDYYHGIKLKVLENYRDSEIGDTIIIWYCNPNQMLSCEMLDNQQDYGVNDTMLCLITHPFINWGNEIRCDTCENGALIIDLEKKEDYKGFDCHTNFLKCANDSIYGKVFEWQDTVISVRDYEEFIASLSITSTKKESLKNHTVCFPNPVADYLNLQGGSKVGGFYQVFALSGTLQSSGQIVNNQIDVSTLPNGVYILKTREENGTLQHHKFVKKGN